MNDEMSTTTTDAELEELRALSGQIAGAESSPWQPRCVAKCFGSAFGVPASAGFRVRFTMQRWIDLEDLRSVLLTGGLPETIEELEAACDIFELLIGELTPQEALDVATGLRRAIEEAFAMAVKVSDPDAAPDLTRDENGFGDWLSLYACLVGQLGVAPSEAKAMDVGEAFALIAAHRGNRGWRVAGMTYKQRDAVPDSSFIIHHSSLDGEEAPPRG